MRWAADVGGMTQFGSVNPDSNEPLFHADWERRVLGLTLAAGGTGSWSIDQGRHARETLPKEFYWSAGYYAIWFEGLVKLLRERGMITEGELRFGKMKVPAVPVKRVLTKDMVAGVLAKGSPYDRPPQSSALFAVDDAVKTKDIPESAHTRLPTYARLKRGVIERVHGAHVFADSSGTGKGENPQWLYSVKFSAEELFGKPSRDYVYLDLWEPYLDAA